MDRPAPAGSPEPSDDDPMDTGRPAGADRPDTSSGEADEAIPEDYEPL